MSEKKESIVSTSALRAYIMLGVLGLIWVYFHWATGSIFLTPTNLSNLATQMSVTAIIAVGMLMVIVSGNTRAEASWMRSTASPNDTPGSRLKLNVTAGSCP